MENGRGNSHSGSGAGERATGTVKALTERAPTCEEGESSFEEHDDMECEEE